MQTDDRRLEVTDMVAGKPESVVPRLDSSGSSHGGRPENFSHYVARQLGFKDGNECPKLSKLASEYARSSKAFEDEMYVYFSMEKEVESLCEKLDEELERCILAYFAFHWSQASTMINKVLSDGSEEKKIKNIFLTATRFDEDGLLINASSNKLGMESFNMIMDEMYMQI